MQFDVAGLLQPPVVEADFVDEGFFDVVGGLEVAAVAFAHVVVLGPFFGREAEGARAEIVLAGVLAGDGFAGRGTGSGGAGWDGFSRGGLVGCVVLHDGAPL